MRRWLLQPVMHGGQPNAPEAAGHASAAGAGAGPRQAAATGQPHEGSGTWWSRVAPLLTSHGHTALVDHERAQTMLARTFDVALLLAAVTAAWTAVDMVFFAPPLAWKLALVRGAACGAFVGLAVVCRLAPTTLVAARAAMGALFLVPALFFGVAQSFLHRVGVHGLGHGMAAAYAFAPFLLACGIAAFPVTVVEAAALASVALVAEYWFLTFADGGLPGLPALDAYWLLLLLASVATYAAATQVSLMMAALQQLLCDPLTGCLRRDSGQALLDVELETALRRRTPLVVLFVDLDHFMQVNDRFGHEVGDHVLARIAAMLRSAVRESDSVLRWGGEEFLLLLPDADSDEAQRCIERLREAGAARLPDRSVVTLSIGVAEHLADVIDDARALVDLADRRRYEAKNAGRNRYVGTGGRGAVIFAGVPAAAS